MLVRRSIIIARLFCVGKSTLMRRLRRGELPIPRRQLDIGIPDATARRDVEEWPQPQPSPDSDILFH